MTDPRQLTQEALELHRKAGPSSFISDHIRVANLVPALCSAVLDALDKNEWHKSEVRKLADWLDQKDERVEELERALRFYANEENYDDQGVLMDYTNRPPHMSFSPPDTGRRARAALSTNTEEKND
jgi:hypothetical protein